MTASGAGERIYRSSINHYPNKRSGLLKVWRKVPVASPGGTVPVARNVPMGSTQKNTVGASLERDRGGLGCRLTSMHA